MYQSMGQATPYSSLSDIYPNQYNSPVMSPSSAPITGSPLGCEPYSTHQSSLGSPSPTHTPTQINAQTTRPNSTSTSSPISTSTSSPSPSHNSHQPTNNTTTTTNTHYSTPTSTSTGTSTATATSTPTPTHTSTYTPASYLSSHWSSPGLSWSASPPLPVTSYQPNRPYYSNLNSSCFSSTTSLTGLPIQRPKLTTTVWEDESTVCYQVDTQNVCVARRQDNDMINGTKLLNVVGMSRGKRDGILKNEKGRVVVKVGAMHLKGVCLIIIQNKKEKHPNKSNRITFSRARYLAMKFKIYDLLFPLFTDDPSAYLLVSLDHPANKNLHTAKGTKTTCESICAPSWDTSHTTGLPRLSQSEGKHSLLYIYLCVLSLPHPFTYSPVPGLLSSHFLQDTPMYMQCERTLQRTSFSESEDYKYKYSVGGSQNESSLYHLPKSLHTLQLTDLPSTFGMEQTLGKHKQKDLESAFQIHLPEKKVKKYIKKN
ncbi:apses-type HTH transcription regulator [Phycomyces blakesleeanus NRRL 1555(-)]|uniref:Apses-type HTH transcription regulator n=1 Tax=Phycomyces blakesleeanus (strain ATCC 8743b / DSM 1359 / FGSC 10004 / NBRC 33097 / NRRL 1555) TaxID=763407 RepID=A0A167NJS9_PHYB8|nr:apses-type HTH transcription regulator [Phycomyces blakesleeanus NRRL 1555(-)]OAD76094.1 apses-type HTH transcription regulator [Phycomyces blakesleeanus NRRL 1555(-)]|eukprot:XP_018294134.1 apses-type HTH transcription regulator [Phycomyces blakesleeanus NRRL 1555(-)]